jgi:hypothetical protein
MPSISFLECASKDGHPQSRHSLQNQNSAVWAFSCHRTQRSNRSILAVVGDTSGPVRTFVVGSVAAAQLPQSGRLLNKAAIVGTVVSQKKKARQTGARSAHPHLGMPQSLFFLSLVRHR